MKIPYGNANFGDIRRHGYFYVDKTPFLPLLESAELGFKNLVFLRPRRMGKSALVSMLAHYYDVARADELDALFGGLWVHDHPTPERNSYVVLHLDFSIVTPDRDPAILARNFFEAVRIMVTPLTTRYADRIPGLGQLEGRLVGHHDAAALIGNLIGIVGGAGHRLYILIDEYDQFANALLSGGDDDVYATIMGATGFVRTFYRMIKMGTGTGAVGRLFVTGVSPMLLDDLHSGFNILTNITHYPQFNELAGFTRDDVERAMDELLAARPDLASHDRGTLLEVMEQYYNGYRFAEGASRRIFNSDMVLYFLRALAAWGAYPTEMLDLNVRTDYGQLRRMALTTGQSGVERRAVLERVLTEGHVWGQLIEQFGRLGPSSTDQFVSLLYYTGMLTLSAVPRSGKDQRFEVPNRVIRELGWEHFAALLKQESGVELDAPPLRGALRAMAVEGAIEPFLEVFHTKVVKAMGVKDLRQFSEKTLKMMLLTCAVVSGVFSVLSEKEFAQGYCDLFFGPSRLVPDARYAWMLELKYLPTAAKAAQIEKAARQAEEQLERYSADAQLIPMLTQGKELRAGTLLFVGHKKVVFRPWPPAKAARREARSRPAKPRPRR